MNITNIINEVLTEVMNTVWYHGTPDAREIIQGGGFSPRMGNTDYISDPERWNELQHEMQIARSNGNDDQYWKAMEQVAPLRKQMQYKKPIFFTNNSKVASSYTKEKPAFDYQESVPKTFKVQINDSGKILQVPAKGERFRNLKADYVRKALIDAGISEEEVDKQFAMFPTDIRNGKMTAETIGIIAQQLGFDIVDVIGVLDSYHGGSVQSNVRMVFDPNRIKIINNNLNENINNDIKYGLSQDEDRLTINAYINNSKVGSVTSAEIFDAYNYDFDDIFSEDEFYEIFTDDILVKIEHLEIDDNYKGKGIGTTLMNKMMNLLNKKGHKQLYLNASPMGFSGLNLYDLVEFYKGFGFKELKNQGNNVIMGIY